MIEENRSYSTVTQPNVMPWLIGEGNTYGHATNYTSNVTGSLLDYLWLSSGSSELSFGCSGGGCSKSITDDNIFRELNARGISWKVYAETLHGAGSMDLIYKEYVARHNPARWYSDIINSQAQQLKMVPFTQFATDLSANQLPTYSIIVPNLKNDAHDGTPQVADAWLSNNVAPVLNQPYFQTGGDGLLIITFDNGDGDIAGQVYTALIGPNVRRNFISNTPYKHQNTLRTMLDALGVTTYPDASATASDMADFFCVNCGGNGTGTILGTVKNLQNGQTISGATVTYSGPATATTATDGSGNYTFSNVPTGTYSVSGIANGYPQRNYTGVTVNQNQSTRQDLQLTTTGKISGSVTGTGGVALNGATVTIMGGDIPTTDTKTTNAAGAYTSDWDPVGSYTVTCAANGYTAQTLTGVVITTGAVTTANCALTAGGTGTISGKVTNLQNAQPISGATVSYDGSATTTTTDSSGNYSFTSVLVGTYSVSAVHAGYPQRIYNGVVVNANQTTVQDLQLTTTGRVSGTVTGTGGVALNGATVTVSGGDIFTTDIVTSNTSGSYISNWDPVGSYSVTCAANGYSSKTVTGVTITSGAVTTVNCALTTGGSGSITGKVTNLQNGQAISGATVTSDASGTSPTTDSLGNYTFSNVPAGTYSVSAIHNGYPQRTYTGVVVSANQTTTQNLQLTTTGRITGTVTNSNGGAAISGATVTISGGDIATTDTKTSSSTGGYMSDWDPVGTYTVTCAAAGFTTLTQNGVTITTGGLTTVNCALGRF